MIMGERVPMTPHFDVMKIIWGNLSFSRGQVLHLHSRWALGEQTHGRGGDFAAVRFAEPVGGRSCTNDVPQRLQVTSKN